MAPLCSTRSTRLVQTIKASAGAGPCPSAGTCPGPHSSMATLEDRLALLQDDVVADYFAMLRYVPTLKTVNIASRV